MLAVVSCSRASEPQIASESHLVTITSAAEFAEAVESSDIPVLVDFWATWCPPCRMMNPILKDIAARYQSSLKVAKVDVDDNKELASTFKIESIPTMILFIKGQPVDQLVGARSKGDLEAWLSEQMQKSGFTFAPSSGQHAN